jgi:phosphatidylserine/phosphatidylglycerophosphate/cardiolipin synthase-like enzyme
MLKSTLKQIDGLVFMVVREIERDPVDEVFRRYVRELINSAEKEILVIAGELGSYKFPDLKWAMRRACARGVKIRIYASNPSQGIVNGLLARGCEIYIGEKAEDHYLIVDSKSMVHSRPHPPVLGVREGEVYIDEPEKVKEKVEHFNSLISKAEKKVEVRWEEDVLWKALQNPPDWGVYTDSTRIDEF